MSLARGGNNGLADERADAAHGLPAMIRLTKNRVT